MRKRLVEFIRRAKDPKEMAQSWNTQEMNVPRPTEDGKPIGVAEPGPSAKSLESFAQDIDMPEELSVSSLQGNPSVQKAPGIPDSGDAFKEKLRRRRAKDYASPERGGLTYG